MAKTLSLSEVKTRLPELVVGVQEREEEVVVTKNGRPAAILINVDEYARLKGTLDVLSDPVLMKQIGRARPSIRPGRRVSRLRTCSANHSLPPRSVALRESLPSRYPSACGRGDPLSPPRPKTLHQSGYSRHCNRPGMWGAPHARTRRPMEVSRPPLSNRLRNRPQGACNSPHRRRPSPIYLRKPLRQASEEKLAWPLPLPTSLQRGEWPRLPSTAHTERALAFTFPR